ncbi:hypothetical protein RIF23_15005 [Lipingzhangella sp. LS1_29]|uniref:Ig-like domain-containing protein n=1 Tax=Lipingzhangella rawalii TaxID=2055835 RepID=A0ABU2H8H6_9ACTN|nr:hypothetical protein [Lipingzhangella rawalii]MDS1271602.1 hypothetical protein [Lipingzhangella rawalii]
MPPYGIDPRYLRPGRRWYWAGSGIIVFAFVLAVGGCGAGLLQAMSSPEFNSQFTAGDEVEFEAPAPTDPDQAWVLYVDTPAANPYEAGDCTVTGPGDPPGLTESSYTHEVDVHGTYWERAAIVQLDQAGTHTISCSSDDAVTYAIAYADSDSAATRSVGMVLGVSLILFTALIAVGGTTVIVTAARRRKHHRQLLQQYYGSAAGPSPGQGGYPPPSAGPPAA